jgi:hypothetical protein
MHRQQSAIRVQAMKVPTQAGVPNKTGQKVILLCCGCLAGLLLVELGLRLLTAQPFVPQPKRDPGYGVRAYIPNISYRQVYPGDFDVRVDTNGDGFRGPKTYPRAKPPGVRRVALIGDSFVFGSGVNNHEVVSAVLERRLADLARGGQHTEVLNFGISGFGQAEELVQYVNFSRGYSPDCVVLFYFDNDIGENSVSRLFTLSGDGSVRRTGNPFLPGIQLQEKLYSIAPTRWLLLHSHLVTWLRNRLATHAQRRLHADHGVRSNLAAETEAVKLTRALVVEFIRETRAAGSHPVLFVVPKPDLSSNFPMTREEIQALGAEWVDGRTFLKPEDYFAHDLHWRPSGHQKAAEALLHCVRP